MNIMIVTRYPTLRKVLCLHFGENFDLFPPQ